MKYPGILTECGIKTKDYDFFVKDKTNRDIKESRLNDLSKRRCKNIDNEDYPFQAPIVVSLVEINGKVRGSISQGQHRFEICKREGRFIHYVITYDDSPASLGQEMKTQDWDNVDLIKSYSNQGYLSYRILYKLKEYNPEYTVIALTAIINGKICSTNKVRDKKFKVQYKGNEEDIIKIAQQRIEKHKQFLLASNRKDKSKELIKVLVNVMERSDFNWNYFIERTIKNSPKINLIYDFNSINSEILAKDLVEKYYNYNSRKIFKFENKKLK